MAEDIQFNISSKGADQTSRGLLQAAGASEKLRMSMGTLSAAAVGLQSAFAPLLAVFAAVRSIQGIGTLLSESSEAYKESEKASRGATEAQQEFAAQAQQVLGIEDDVTLGLMKKASALGISQQKMDEVTLAAIGLSKATGAGLDESLKKVNQAIRGNANALGESIPGLQKLATEEQKLAAISELANRGLANQKDEMQGLEGIQTRATNAFGDLKESIGAILAPIQSVIAYGWAVFAETMQRVLVPAVDAAKAAMSSLPAILDFVAKAIVGTITVVDVAITNMPEIFAFAMAKAESVILGFVEGFKYFFTVEIPAYASWFGRNFINLMSDAFFIVVDVVKTAINAIGESIVNTWDWVASGFEGGFAGLLAKQMQSGAELRDSFLKGFQSSTEPLPDVMVRQLTERETQLAEKMASIGANLGGQFADKFNSRLASVQDKFDGFNSKISLTQDKSAMSMLGEQKSASTELKSVESRLLTRGRGDDPNAKVADNTAATVKELQGLREDVKGLNTKSNIPYMPGVVGL